MDGYGLGRLPVEDERDAFYLMSAMVPDEVPPARHFRYWWSNGWWGNQESTPHCVAYSWLHFLEDGPITQAPYTPGAGPLMSPRAVYDQCQQVDEWPGESYDGTSVRAGAKVLQRQGLVAEYRWAWNLDTAVTAVLTTSPVVMGTLWYDSMFYPDDEGIVGISGAVAGGHAWLLNGVSLTRGLARGKNSWGREWGKDGHFYIPLESLSRLIEEDGEACIAAELEAHF